MEVENILGFEVNLTLLETHPSIQRKITLAKSTTFKQFHDIIRVLFGFKDTNKYLFHISEDIKIFEYSDAGYCMDDVYETDVNTYFEENYSYAYEYSDNTSWLVKIDVKKQMDDVSLIPKLTSINGKFNPSNISDINTFNQVMLYMKKPNEYPKELYNNELNQIEIVNKKLLQDKINSLYKEENGIQTNEYVDPNYSLDKYF